MITFTDLLAYLSFPYVRYAFAVGALVALCASLLGVTLVLKRFSYLGDGLSHVAFGAMAVCAVFNISNELYLTMPVTIFTAILLLGIPQNKKIGGDASLAMLSVGSLAIGYILLNLFPASSNVAADVCSSLFGSSSILTLGTSDLVLSVVMSVVVCIVFVLFYNKVFALTFDPVFMQASGGNARAYNLLIATVTAIVISVSMRLVGSLLVSALIIFPAVCAMSIKKSFRGVVVTSAIIGVSCSLLGMTASILFSTPTGASIVICDILALALCTAVSKLRR